MTAHNEMDIHEIRRRNLRRLAAGYKNRAEFARAIGRSDQQAWALVGEKSTKGIGGRIARDIEEKLNLERGSLDHLDDLPAPEEQAGLNEQLLLDCLRAVRQEITRLGLQLDPEDADELLVRATMLLYSFSQDAGELLPAHTALKAARL